MIYMKSLQKKDRLFKGQTMKNNITRLQKSKKRQKNLLDKKLKNNENSSSLQKPIYTPVLIYTDNEKC